MKNLIFERWCRKAVSRIVLVNDRIAAGRELMGHIEERCQDFLEQGFDLEDAEQKTLEAMGDPEELSYLLGAAYHPFWFILQQKTRKVLAVMLCITLFFMAMYFLRNDVLYVGYSKPTYIRYHPYKDTYIVDSIGTVERIFYEEPNEMVFSDGYFLTLKRAALWHGDYRDSLGRPQEDDYFHFEIEISNPLPWAEYDDVFRWFWAEDSLGNRYYSAYECNGNTEPSVQGTAHQTKAMSRIWDLYLTDYISHNAEWLELHYDRGGRDLVLRIDLTGGMNE